jgi:hypothetical protein
MVERKDKEPWTVVLLSFLMTGFLVFGIFLSSYESTLFLVWNTEVFPGRKLILLLLSYSSSTENCTPLRNHTGIMASIMSWYSTGLAWRLHHELVPVKWHSQ